MLLTRFIGHLDCIISVVHYRLLSGFALDLLGMSVLLVGDTPGFAVFV